MLAVSTDTALSAGSYESMAARAGEHGQLETEVRALIEMSYPLFLFDSRRCVEVAESALRLSAERPNQLLRARARSLFWRPSARHWNVRSFEELGFPLSGLRQAAGNDRAAANGGTAGGTVREHERRSHLLPGRPTDELRVVRARWWQLPLLVIETVCARPVGGAGAGRWDRADPRRLSRGNHCAIWLPRRSRLPFTSRWVARLLPMAGILKAASEFGGCVFGLGLLDEIEAAAA
jgi:hypothetical protein